MTPNTTLQHVIQNRIEHQYLILRNIAREIDVVTAEIPNTTYDDIDETLRYLTHSLSVTVDQLYELHEQYHLCKKRQWFTIVLDFFRGVSWKNIRR